MTESSRLDDALRAAARGDLEEEARLILAIARVPDDCIAAAYANGRLPSEAPRLVRTITARLGEIREQAAAASASTSRPLSADDLGALPSGTVVRDADGEYWIRVDGVWDYLDWRPCSHDSPLRAEDCPRLAGHVDLGEEDA